MSASSLSGDLTVEQAVERIAALHGVAMPPPGFIFDDGGRAAAGFKGRAGDCAARAISIATGESYAAVYVELNRLGKAERPRRRPGRAPQSSAREGVYRETVDRFLSARGWRFVPCIAIGSGCKVHLRADELPAGQIVVRLSRHFAAVIDGVLRDTYDSSRGGTRCVYGYWVRP